MEDLHDLTPDLIAARELLEETNSASLVAVPLRALQRLVGVLTIALPGAHRFSPEEVATSAEVAEALAAWLANAQLHEQMTREIAERRRTEEALRESEERLRLLVEGATEHATFLLDAEGRVVAWNLGCPADEGLLGGRGPRRRFRQVLHRRGDRCRQAAAGAGDRRARREIQEAVRVRKNASTFAASVVLSALRAKDGRMRGNANVTRDVTERRRHEQEMQQLRDEWVSLIAHDLRHPLNIISVAAATLVRHPADKSAVISSAEHIVRSARNPDRMIADLSDFSVLEAKSLKLVCRACDVPKMAREAVERIRAASDRAIVLHCSGEWVIEADDGRLNQVFDNLLSNAVKYGDPQSPIDVLISEGDDAVEVTVTNRGVGISASELPFLFKSRLGNRVLRPGLGLSLYICKGLVEAHGGSIRADSTPGQRTAIKLSLPLRAAVQSARAAQTE